MSFLHTLVENCQKYNDKVALEFLQREGENPQVTYGELGHNVERTMAYLLDHGVQSGDRVALQLPKCLPFLYLHLAIMRLGAITLPLNPAYPPQELRYFLEDAEASLFFTCAGARKTLQPMLEEMAQVPQLVLLDCDNAESFASHLDGVEFDHSALPPIPDNADRTALMIYTSGTTGRPKGAMITHGNLTANIEGLHEAWGWREDDVLLHVLPIFHVHGLVVALHGALHAGATALLMPKFDAEWTLQTLQDRRCTVFMAVPTIHRLLLQVPNAGTYDLSYMRLLTSGSDRLPDDVFKAFQKTFGHTLLERYGMTETGMNLSNPLRGERRVGSVGLPLPGVEARIVDPETGEALPDGEVGEVQIRGPHVCKGYWRQPQKTAEAFTDDGWLRTGDLGLREPDGYYTLKGRSKDLIISGGYNVYPPEVELALAEHPAVGASAVIGCPDEKWGERVTAVIVRNNGTAADEEEIIAHCRQYLAPYKVPKTVMFVESMPRNALGKIQKARLRASLCNG
ncbi:MAG TPA: AMP-binding protein [Candidatus Sulfomarinibacteraceae bacterium]|nr:AMP-binding protein [Candidatus Sulfomarinibacteraceae bacterium]